MGNTITFFVPGIPAPGGSKRGFHIPALNRVVITDACKRTKPWQQAVKAVALDAYRGDPLTGPLAVIVSFHMPRPKGHFGSGKNAATLKPSAPSCHTVKPDATKLWRAFEDALTGIVWRDDAQICHQSVGKLWAEGTPGARVTITRISELPRAEVGG